MKAVSGCRMSLSHTGQTGSCTHRHNRAVSDERACGNRGKIGAYPLGYWDTALTFSMGLFVPLTPWSTYRPLDMVSKSHNCGEHGTLFTSSCAATMLVVNTCNTHVKRLLAGISNLEWCPLRRDCCHRGDESGTQYEYPATRRHVWLRAFG